MNNKQGKTHKLLDFFAGKGFYVVLILCVAAIGASGYMLFFGGSDDTPDTPVLALVSPGAASPGPSDTPTTQTSPAPSPALPPTSPPPIAIPSPPRNEVFGNEGGFPGPDVAVFGNPSPAPTDPPPAADPPEPSPQPPASPSFIPPVSGEMIVGFSESANVFFEAMREWRYHPGIDIETLAHAAVQAAADGVIKEVIEDAPRHMGATVVIEHAGGYRSVYSNLTIPMIVTAGSTVKAGDIIGAVGNTSIAESALPPHLHFEIWKDGEPVDPMDYLP